MIGAEKTDTVFGPSATHSISITQIQARLTIETEIRDFFVAAQQKFDDNRIRHD